MKELEDAPSEVEALTAQITVLKEMLQKSRAVPQDRQRLDALQRTLHDKDQEIRQLQEFKILYQRLQTSQKQFLREQDKLIADHQLLQHDLKAARTYADELNQELETLYGQMQTIKEAYQKVEEERLRCADEQQQQVLALQTLEEQCRNQAKHLECLEDEMEALKNSSSATLKSTNDLQERYQEAIKEKDELADYAFHTRQELLALKEDVRNKDDQIKEAIAAKQRSKQQVTTIELQLSESQKQQCHLQMALTDLRRDRESLQKSKTAIEAELHKNRLEKSELESKLRHALEEKNRRVSELQQQLDNAVYEQSIKDELVKKVEDLQAIIQQSHDVVAYAEANYQQLAAELQAKNAQLDELTHQLSEIKRTHNTFQDELANVQRALEVRDAELQMAQQHLAKKVKDSARLSERAEEAERRANEMEQMRDEARKRLISLESDIENDRRRQSEQETRWQQRINEAETKWKHWEKEHSRTFQQWQQAEESNKQLRELEVKYNQVSTMFANLGQMFSPPRTVEAEPLKPSKVESKLQAMEDQDLFAAPEPQRRPKRNLFENE